MLRILRNFFYLLIVLALLGVATLWLYALKLEKEYGLSDEDLGGALWSMPARVYARPLELYVGAPVTQSALVRELTILDFVKTADVVKPNQYAVEENSVLYYAPAFVFWDTARPARRMRVTFDDGKISQIDNLTTLEPVVLERLNPLRIASIYPKQRADRILIGLKDVPKVLIDALIATEDRNFWVHPGVDIRGLMRAVYVTLVKKNGQQGGSTLTQQFIKNHYLDNSQRVSRKIKEILMALTLECYASKEKILEGYINEIYLGQDGQRAIHGFGLASEYFFNKPLDELGLHQIALLVSLVREPGNADPRLHPEYALKRRNLILRVMQEQKLISIRDEQLASALPLDIVPKEITRDRIRFPAFVDLVYRQLYQNYSKEDLTKQGLNIFTTLDPQYQLDVQSVLSQEVERLERSKGLKRNFLQGAAVVVNSRTAEVLSVIGSRVSAEHGFNRAISARRQIGSLIKPAVYLAALEYPSLYSLATRLDDSPFTYRMNGETWSPKDYDRKNRTNVLLIDALVNSYNIPTVRVALNLGLKDIVNTLKRIGARDGIKPYPSLSLGAVLMTPLEVTQIYETFANGGYFQPLRSIREITTSDGKVVKRYSMSSIRAIEPTPYHLILTAMQEIPRRGTAKAVYKQFESYYNFAGKTGTTDDYRDSWFAGFSGNMLTVAWIGNDKNKSTPFSGSNGGLPLWMAIMKQLPLEPLQLKKPDGIVTRTILRSNGKLAGWRCTNTLNLPFISGYEPKTATNCYEQPRIPVHDNDDVYNSDNPIDTKVPNSLPNIHNQPSQIQGHDPSQWFRN